MGPARALLSMQDGALEEIMPVFEKLPRKEECCTLFRKRNHGSIPSKECDGPLSSGLNI